MDQTIGTVNDVEVRVHKESNGTGFFSANSKDEQALRRVAEITGMVEGVEKVEVEAMHSRSSGDYWRMTAWF